MHTRVEKKNGISIITLTGDCLLDQDHSRIRDTVYELIRGKNTEVVIDLRGVQHMNSCGLGALVSAYTSLCRVGGHLRLAAMGRFIDDLMNITHLHTVFQIYPSVDEAIAQSSAGKL